MAHGVYYRTDGGTRFEEVADLEAAVARVEQLRNEEGVSQVRVFREVPIQIKTYYKVSVVDEGADGEPGGGPAPTPEPESSDSPRPTPSAPPPGSMPLTPPASGQATSPSASAGSQPTAQASQPSAQAGGGDARRHTIFTRGGS